MNQTDLENLKKQLKQLEYHNRMAPFPVYDTEYVESIRIKINKMEEELNKNKYDEEAVEACRMCNSLNLQYDDEKLNIICVRCGSKNEMMVFETIHDYKKFING